MNYRGASHATSSRCLLLGENRFIDSSSRHSEAYPTLNRERRCNGRRKSAGYILDNGATHVERIFFFSSFFLFFFSPFFVPRSFFFLLFFSFFDTCRRVVVLPATRYFFFKPSGLLLLFSFFFLFLFWKFNGKFVDRVLERMFRGWNFFAIFRCCRGENKISEDVRICISGEERKKD